MLIYTFYRLVLSVYWLPFISLKGMKKKQKTSLLTFNKYTSRVIRDSEHNS